MSWHLPDYKSASENAEQKEREALRDQFAMAALTGLLAAPNVELWIDVPKQAYTIADRMLETRKTKK